MEILKRFTIPLVIGLLVAGFTFILNKETVDIRYTLSENIPIDIENQDLEHNVQQLVIKNLGNAKAEKIIVDIQADITNYKIIKNAEIDKEQIYNKSDRLQIVYPELPPEGILKISMQTEGNAIKLDNVRIRHNNGEAVEALAIETNKYRMAITWILALAYLVLFLLVFRDSAVNSLESDAKYYKYMHILKRNSIPFYVKKSKWEKIREIACESFIKDNIWGNNDEIENKKYYKLLSNDKPEYFSEEEWDTIIEKLSKELEHDINKCISTYYSYPKELIYLLKLKKPKNLKENLWDNLRGKILKRYIEVIKTQSVKRYNTNIEQLEVYLILSKHTLEYLEENEIEPFYKELNEHFESLIKDKIPEIYDLEKISTYLKIQKPYHYNDVKWQTIKELMYRRFILLKKYEAINYFYLDINFINKELNKENELKIPEEYWKDYIKFIKKIYYINILLNIYNENNPINYLDNQLKEYLINENELKKLAYTLQVNNYYIKAMKEDFSEFKEKPKPKWIKEDDYNMLSKYLEDKSLLRSLINENKDINSKLEEEKLTLKEKEEEFVKLRNKVTNQLMIINNLLDDATSLDKIEEYNNCFAKGNYENLKKIADMLKKSNTN